MPSINSKCSECGSLGPHLFAGNSGVPAEPPHERSIARRESYPVERVERAEPPARFDSFGGGEAADVASEPSPRMHDSGGDDDIKFPAGMRSRSPILDAIENIGDDYGERRSSKHRDSDSDYEEVSDDVVDDEYVDEDEEEEEGKPEKQGMSLTAIVASVILILLLVAAAFYVYNNFDTVSSWLSSPTTPEVVSPSQ